MSFTFKAASYRQRGYLLWNCHNFRPNLTNLLKLGLVTELTQSRYLARVPASFQTTNF